MSRLARFTLLAALALAGASTALGAAVAGNTGADDRPADRPADVNPVRRCIAEIMNIAQNTVHAIRATTANGVQAIIRLDNQGASSETLINAARRAHDAVVARASRSAAMINNLADHCIDALQRPDTAAIAGADPTGPSGMNPVDLINAARRRALTDIRTAAMTSSQAIHAALDRALGPDPTPAGRR